MHTYTMVLLFIVFIVYMHAFSVNKGYVIIRKRVDIVLKLMKLLKIVIKALNKAKSMRKVLTIIENK